MGRHFTLSDKDRSIDLIIDGEWHSFDFRDESGSIVTKVRPDYVGVYMLQCQLNGRILALPASAIEVRIQRYPLAASTDGSTAWDFIDIFHTVAKGRWYGTRPMGKIEINTIGHPDGSSHVGIDYRVRQNPLSMAPGRLTVEDRTLKFVFITSDVAIL